ncbi:hypothetical protein V9T40_014254 [Parthenolecanium corni]|uniref:Dynein heavy chain n=1 Tax=Parthenolecanium corni TaxID=536013 RepID=A0AAN9XWU9_9HEMI
MNLLQIHKLVAQWNEKPIFVRHEMTNLVHNAAWDNTEVIATVNKSCELPYSEIDDAHEEIAQMENTLNRLSEQANLFETAQVDFKIIQTLRKDLNSNMISSKFISYFLEEVSEWQKTLANADQLLSIWLEVQRTWLYLQSIFVGSLFSALIREQTLMVGSGPKWMIMDGDVDPMWIESLNTLMDDNKTLLMNNKLLNLPDEYGITNMCFNYYTTSACGEIPDLFSDDEITNIINNIRPENLESTLQQLREKLEEANQDKENCIMQKEETSEKINLSNRLVKGLSSESVRWQESITKCFVEEKLGSKYVEVKNNSLLQTLKQMNATTPIFFILSPGVDPMRSSIKITNEPPTGILANLHKALDNFDQETLESSSKEGELSITTDMEELEEDIYLDKIPKTWENKAYPSLLGLSTWFSDLLCRLKELEAWVADFCVLFTKKGRLNIVQASINSNNDLLGPLRALNGPGRNFVL